MNDITEVRYLSQSQVSASVKLLKGHGYIKKGAAQDNKKAVHLKNCEAAAPVMAVGRAAQGQFKGAVVKRQDKLPQVAIEQEDME